MKVIEQSAEMKTIQGREISALLNPRPVVLVTCCDAAGKVNVLTVAWQTPLSHNPPLLGISLNQRHYSHALIAESGEFALNVVGEGFCEAVEMCGICSGRDTDKVAEAGLGLIPAQRIRPPLIAGALAHLECIVKEQVQAGDHTFFVGEIVSAAAQAGSFSDRWEPPNGDVLLCLQRDRFSTWFSG
jgi:flavin reductase (DIM6/NTAB) family NADH-FMN oxidoreductase RutF